MLALQYVYITALVLPGLCSGNLLEINCSDISEVQCGDDVTVTCNISHSDYNVTLSADERKIIDIPHLKENYTKDNIFIEVTEDLLQLKLTISNVKYSIASNYSLHIGSHNGYRGPYVHVQGVCDPEISIVNEEYICEVESYEELQLGWMDSHRKVFTGESIPMKGYKLHSSLKKINAISATDICCYVFKEDMEEKKMCRNISEMKGPEALSEHKVQYSVIIPLMVILVIICVFLAMKHRRRRIIVYNPPTENNPGEGDMMQEDVQHFTQVNRVSQGCRWLRDKVIVRQGNNVQGLQDNQGLSQDSRTNLMLAQQV